MQVYQENVFALLHYLLESLRHLSTMQSVKFLLCMRAIATINQGAIKHGRGNALINDRPTCDAH
jgi:hypothetical protein